MDFKLSEELQAIRETAMILPRRKSFLSRISGE